MRKLLTIVYYYEGSDDEQKDEFSITVEKTHDGRTDVFYGYVSEVSEEIENHIQHAIVHNDARMIAEDKRPHNFGGEA